MTVRRTSQLQEERRGAASNLSIESAIVDFLFIYFHSSSAKKATWRDLENLEIVNC